MVIIGFVLPLVIVGIIAAAIVTSCFSIFSQRVYVEPTYPTTQVIYDDPNVMLQPLVRPSYSRMRGLGLFNGWGRQPYQGNYYGGTSQHVRQRGHSQNPPPLHTQPANTGPFPPSQQRAGHFPRDGGAMQMPHGAGGSHSSQGTGHHQGAHFR